MDFCGWSLDISQYFLLLSLIVGKPINFKIPKYYNVLIKLLSSMINFPTPSNIPQTWPLSFPIPSLPQNFPINASISYNFKSHYFKFQFYFTSLSFSIMNKFQQTQQKYIHSIQIQHEFYVYQLSVQKVDKIWNEQRSYKLLHQLHTTLQQLMNRNLIIDLPKSRLQNIGNRTIKNSESYSTEQIGKKVNFKSNTDRVSHVKTEMDYHTDSLQNFQEELEMALKSTPTLRKKKIKHIEVDAQMQMQDGQQVQQMKKKSLTSQREFKIVESKLEKLLSEIQEKKKKNESESERERIQNQRKMMSNYQNAQPPYMMSQPPVIYNQPQQPVQQPVQQQQPPVPYYVPYPIPTPTPMPQSNHCHHMHHCRRFSNSSQESESSSSYQSPKKSQKSRRKSKREPPQKSKSKSIPNPSAYKQFLRRKLRKIFIAVTFTIFVKSEAKKLSQARRKNLKNFYTQKFDSQTVNIKNWLLESHKYFLSIILEKSHLNFKFFEQKSAKVREEKEKLIMHVLGIATKKLQDEATPQKISLFSELLYYFCRKGSFAINRFWTAHEMEQLCISEYYGCIRADQSLQKFLLTVMVFIKIFIYNMLLQPHKFDSENFPKNSEPITTNMRVIGSVYYHIIKEIIEEYRNQNRDSYFYKSGNWLSVPSQFIIQCCQPLIIKNSSVEADEYISGLFPFQVIYPLREKAAWKQCQERIKFVIDKLHVEICLKAKGMKKNLKLKLYS